MSSPPSLACPHCHADLGSGFVSQDTLVERIKSAGKAARDERDEVIRERDAMKDAAARAIEYEKRATKAEADFAQASTQLSRTHSLVAAGFRDAKMLRGFGRAYEDYAAEAGAKAVEFDAWLSGPAREDPILAPHFASSSSTNPPAPLPPGAPPPPSPAAPAAALPRLPNPNVGAAEPPKQGKMSPQQLREYLAGPAFRALKPEEQRARRAELKAQMG